MIKKLVFIFLLAIVFLRVSWVIFDNRTKYVPDYWKRYPVLKDMYGQSQYMMKGWKYWLPDETVYSFAAGAYVKGANPIIVESTQPPLGKYLIGLSILATGNENIIVAVFYVLLIVGIGVLSYQMTRNIYIAMVMCFASSFQNLFSDQLSSTPLLDIFHITFVLYGIIVAGIALEKKKPLYLLLAYGFLGASLMIKVWLVSAVFILPLSVYICFKYRAYVRYVAVGWGIMLVILFASYTQMFLAGYNILEVLKVQKWLYWYQAGKRNRLFLIWPLIFLNRWYVWWGETPISFDPHWSFSWPVAIGLGMYSSIRIVLNRFAKMNAVTYISATSLICYCIFMSMGQPSARYLLPILPLCYGLAGWLLNTCARVYLKKYLL